MQSLNMTLDDWIYAPCSMIGLSLLCFLNCQLYAFEHFSKNLPIMLNIMIHYAKLCSINCKKLPMFSATSTYNYSNSEYLISYRAN